MSRPADAARHTPGAAARAPLRAADTGAAAMRDRPSRAGTWWAYLQLLRPANVATAAADVLAGYAAAGAVTGTAASGALGAGAAVGVSAAAIASPDRALVWLIAAGCCLYGGGIVLNDVFDRALDAVERPERPIPSGRASVAGAATMGVALLGTGVMAALQATPAAGAIAVAIAAACVLYDAWSKHHGPLGSMNMGLCRGLDFLLGVAVIPAALRDRWPLALFAFVYIAAVTALSRGEVRGGTRRVAQIVFAALVGVVAGLLLLALFVAPAAPSWAGVIVAGLLAWQVWPPFWRAVRQPRPEVIRPAIRAGVLSLVVLNAAIAAAYAGVLWALLVLATAVIARLLARAFAVT